MTAQTFLYDKKKLEYLWKLECSRTSQWFAKLKKNSVVSSVNETTKYRKSLLGKIIDPSTILLREQKTDGPVIYQG